MLRLELVTLDGTKFNEEVHEILLPTPDGQIAVFPHHMSLVSLASPGIIAIRRKSNDPDDLMEYFATNGGVIEVEGSTVRVLVDEATQAEEVDEAEALKAYDAAQKLRQDAKDQVSLNKAQALIDRQAVRLKLAGLKRRQRRR